MSHCMKFEQKHIQCDLRFVAYGSGKKFGKKKKKFKRMKPPQMSHGISGQSIITSGNFVGRFDRNARLV